MSIAVGETMQRSLIIVLRLFLLHLTGWFFAIVVYVFSAFVVSRGKLISLRDLIAVSFWTLIILASLLPLYYSSLRALRNRLTECRPVFAFPFLSALFGIVPTAILIMWFGGRMSDLLSPEAFLFYCGFGIYGVVFGVGFVWMSGHSLIP